MTEHKDPGITIELIRLINANIGMLNQGGTCAYNLQLTGLERRESSDGKTLDVFTAFDLMHGVEKPVFTFTCSFVVRYIRQNEDSMLWKDFSAPMALAHLIPYLREFTSNMTNRMPVPVLLLPAFNTAQMLAEFEERRASETVNKATASG